jgi:hypothetical protein
LENLYLFLFGHSCEDCDHSIEQFQIQIRLHRER